MSNIIYLTEDERQNITDELRGTLAQCGIGFRCKLNRTGRKALEVAQQAEANDLHGFEALLNEYRAGIAKPLSQMTEAEREAVLSEHIGAEISENPYLW